MFLALEFSNDRRTAGVMGSPADDFYHFFFEDGYFQIRNRFSGL